MARITTSKRTGSSSKNYVECYVDYTTSTSNTAVTISVTQMSLHHTVGWKDSFTYSYWTSGTLQSGNSHISNSTSVSNKQYSGNGTTKVLGGQSKSFTRTTYAYNIVLHGRMTTHSTNYDGSATITVPARAKYNVTFNVQGHGTAPATQSVFYGYAATKPTDPTDTEWTFGGWYKESACTNAWNFSTGITAATTLYAKWTRKTVKVYAKVGGVWKNGQIFAKVGASWLQPYIGYVKDVTWKQIK